MKRILIGILTIFFLLFSFFTHATWADCTISVATGGEPGVFSKLLSDCSASDDNQGLKYATSTDSGEKGIQKQVVKIVNGALQFAALFAIAALVISGIMYTTAYNNDGQLKTAKTVALYAALGLFITLISFPMVNTIIAFFYNLGK